MMKFWKKSPDQNPEHEMDAEFDQALKDFRSSVHAWSETAYSRPHHPVKIYRTSWRIATACALGCVLAAGGLGGGLLQHHHNQELARIAAAAEAARQQELAEQRAQKENEDLLAKVDSDLSREVPSAMEPLAQLMADDEPQ
jgi:hypothetical protein